jgi:hypothetical protein
MARLSPRAFTQAKKQLRQEVSERVERGGVTTDQTVTDIWTEALGYIRDYVARTLNKSSHRPACVARRAFAVVRIRSIIHVRGLCVAVCNDADRLKGSLSSARQR